jgi:multidrug efflux pump subunit AcrA (membrane-fusion protein)
MSADVTLPEMPGRRFTGKLVRTADSMDPTTRTLLVEVDVPNQDNKLFPGAYSEVHFKMKSQEGTLIIPSTSLIFREQGLRVPIVKGGKTSLIPVTTGRDFGNTIEILSGLDAGADIVSNPPDSIVEGETVRVLRGKVAKQVAE